MATLLLVALMGPVRGPLVLFPYGALALWLGWCWRGRRSWWLSWGVGLCIGTAGFLVRVAVLSLLLGENLWVLITTTAAGLLERLSEWLQLGGGPDLPLVQLMALGLVLFQNLIYVLAVHAVAYWIFPRLRSPISEPPGSAAASARPRSALMAAARFHRLSGDPQLAQRWCDRLAAATDTDGSGCRLLLLLAGTETAAVPGISAAGATPASRRRTAAADAELLLLGPGRPRPTPCRPCRLASARP